MAPYRGKASGIKSAISVLLSCTTDAHEEQDAAVIDVPGYTYIQDSSPRRMVLS